jgi:3D (Asp-Asp-Asp) domain-containing protein
MAVPPIARRLLLLVVVAALVLAVFTTRTRDSTEEVFDAEGRPRLGTAIRFDATAYCKGETSAAGVGIRHGIAAADPTLLPLGSVVQVETTDGRYSGVWTVLDTGPEIQGRELDLYLWNCNEALAFGRQSIRVTILRLGWDPAQSAPGPVEQLFRRRERARPPQPAAPAPATPAPTPQPPPASVPSTAPPPAAPEIPKPPSGR